MTTFLLGLLCFVEGHPVLGTISMIWFVLRFIVGVIEAILKLEE